MQYSENKSNDNSIITWRWEGEAFGNTPAQELGTVSINLRFPGQYYDSETNLHYNMMRYYDPTIGRYITSDPIGLDGGMNTYLYAKANPIINIDPEGLAWAPGQIGISWDEFQEINRSGVEDPCGCLLKAFIGWEDITVAAGATATAPIINKPRTGTAGGGPSGSKTSIASTAIHKATSGGKGGRGKTARKVARKIGTKFIPGVGVGVLIYDIYEFDKCMKECDSCEK